MKNILILRGKVVTPIFTSAQAKERYCVSGENELGKYIACRLDNRADAALWGWYILVSPEDRQLIMNYNWCGNISGPERTHIQIRRRESIKGKECSFQLQHEIWERFSGILPTTIWRLGHPLDFRRSNLSLSRSAGGCRGVTWSHNAWQVQATPKGKTIYIGRASSLEEGYRMYNRYLQEIKDSHPNDFKIQKMPYNDITPQF